MTGEHTRQALPERTAAARLLVVARAQAATDYDSVLDTLVEAGIKSVELTLTTPGTLDRLPGLVERYGTTLDLGVGTVTHPDEVVRAADAGARYIVTPNTYEPVITQSLTSGLPIIPGGLTPTELFASWSAGAAAVKIFPAGVVGPSYLKDLHGPFPDIQVVPSGGVDLESAEAWLAAGAVAVSVGGPLLGDAFRGGNLVALRDRAESFVAVASGESAR